MDDVQLTMDGEPEGIFNGIPDWVYEGKLILKKNYISTFPPFSHSSLTDGTNIFPHFHCLVFHLKGGNVEKHCLIVNTKRWKWNNFGGNF